MIADTYRYVCAGHKERGPSVCSNGLRVPRTLVEEKVLAGLKEDLFTKEGFDLFLKETTRLLTERTRQRPPKQDRLAKVEQDIRIFWRPLKLGF